MKTELGKYLQHARVDLGLTMQHMADQVGVSQAYLSAVENGKKDINYVVVGKLIEVLGLESFDKIRDFEIVAFRCNKTLKVDLSNMTDESVRLMVILSNNMNKLDNATIETIRSLVVSELMTKRIKS